MDCSDQARGTATPDPTTTTDPSAGLQIVPLVSWLVNNKTWLGHHGVFHPIIKWSLLADAPLPHFVKQLNPFQDIKAFYPNVHSISKISENLKHVSDIIPHPRRPYPFGSNFALPSVPQLDAQSEQLLTPQ